MEDLTDLFSRSCACADFAGDTEKSFCYVEGTKVDRKAAENSEELTENVWFESKPPKMFRSRVDNPPSITARQVEIARIRLAGRHMKANDDGEDRHKEKINVSMQKKKSAVHFLSTTTIEETD